MRCSDLADDPVRSDRSPVRAYLFPRCSPRERERVADDDLLHRLQELAGKLAVPVRCRFCRSTPTSIDSLVYCHGCRNSFHSQCWEKFEDHVESEFRPEPCREPADLTLHIWVSHLHASDREHAQLVKNLIQDRPHRWVGIPDAKDDRIRKAELLLYPVLAWQFTSLGVTAKQLPPRKQHPRLVSFFGDTGTGKSTMIKNLIRLLSVSEHHDVPVTSPSSESHNSTSGGIHAYHDPSSQSSDAPIVYLDCEGLRGSEPLSNLQGSNGSGLQSRRSIRHAAREIVPQSIRTHRSSARIPALRQAEATSSPPPVATMRLPWVDQGESRSWTSVVVKTIYPRFLYIFSDVVCYVSGSSRTAEDDVVRLIEWAHNAHDLTTNQGIRPGLIYIINQDNHSDLNKWLDVDFATSAVLNKLKFSEHLGQQRKLWQSRGAKVDTVVDLLSQYYSSLKVVFMPQFLPRQPTCSAATIKQQYLKLYRRIAQDSEISSERRQRAGVLFDMESIARHSVRVLGELAANPACCIDLHGLSAQFKAYPTNFNSHAINFLSKLMKRNDTRASDVGFEVHLVRRVIGYMALCVAGTMTRESGKYLSGMCQLLHKWP